MTDIKTKLTHADLAQFAGTETLLCQPPGGHPADDLRAVWGLPVMLLKANGFRSMRAGRGSHRRSGSLTRSSNAIFRSTSWTGYNPLRDARAHHRLMHGDARAHAVSQMRAAAPAINEVEFGVRPASVEAKPPSVARQYGGLSLSLYGAAPWLAFS